jgi:hypothetical protein
MIQLKIDLYKALLDKPIEDLSDREIDILYILSRDYDIQKILQYALSNEERIKELLI